MRDYRPENNTTSKEDAYLSLQNIKLLYQQLSETHKLVFLRSLNKNPIRKIIESPVISIDRIYNFYAFEDYFIYQPDGREGMILLVNKVDINKVAKNLRTSFINDWKTKKYLLN